MTRINVGHFADTSRQSAAGSANRPFPQFELATKLPQNALELLVRRQITPLPDRQMAQIDLADPHAFEPGDQQSHLLAHAPDLAFFALAQHKAQLLGVLPADLRRAQRLAVQAQAVAQQLELL